MFRVFAAICALMAKPVLAQTDSVQTAPPPPLITIRTAPPPIVAVPSAPVAAPTQPHASIEQTAPRTYHPSWPRPLGRLADWASDADYPAGARSRKVQGVTSIKLTIASTGVPTDCAIIRSSGDAELDKTTCTLLLARARFEPATDRAGLAISGTYSCAVRWQLPNADSISAPLLSAPLPGKIVEIYDIREDGTKTNCSMTASGAMAAAMPPNDHAPLCRNFPIYKPVVDAKGKPVRTHFVVELRVSATPVP